MHERLKAVRYFLWQIWGWIVYSDQGEGGGHLVKKIGPWDLCWFKRWKIEIDYLSVIAVLRAGVTQVSHIR